MNRYLAIALTGTTLAMLLTAGALALEPIPDKLVVLTFDDASRSHVTVAAPLLKKHGFGATFFVSEGFDFSTNKRDYLTWEEIAQLHRDGFEIGNHTRDHKPPSAQDPKGAIEQIEAINSRCQAHGIARPVSFAYPGNALDMDVLPILHRLGIKFARRGGSPECPYDKGRGFAYEPGLDHPLLIPSAGDARPGWSLDDFKRAVCQAKGGKIAVIQLHGVPDTAHSWVSTPAPSFESYVKYLADNGYRVVALRELARYVDPTVVPANPWRVIEGRKDLLSSGSDGSNAPPALSDTTLRSEPAEVRYLGFQVFTAAPDPAVAIGDLGAHPLGPLPGRPQLDAFVQDVIRKIGTLGEGPTQLAVVFGPLAFDHSDAEIERFIKTAFAMALERKIAVGFHLDDSMFWARRDDLWRGPENVEWLDWKGTPNTGRRIDWNPQPYKLPPQMCFNSKAIQQEVRRRAAEVFGKAIAAGIDGLKRRGKERLFAGVIAGWETHIGRDFDTGRSLGYHALVNRGFSSTHPPRDMDTEREKVVEEFISLWTQGLADGGVPASKIYSHLGSLPKRMFEGNHRPTLSYSQANGFAPPWVAFGKSHRAGFSTYPQPGLFEQIYEELARHGHPAWATCEGTNLRLGTGPGQSGMDMETYLAKSFNHGATLVNLFGWVVGDEAKENEGFRLVTAGEESLRAYRKFLRGERLAEAVTEISAPSERPVSAPQPTSPAESDTAGGQPQANGQAPLPEKMQKLGAGVQKWQQEGRDLTPIMSIMQEFEPLMKQGKLPEAEAVIDRAIQALGSAAKIKGEEVSGGMVGPFDRAQWIWCVGEEVPQNFYLYCRKAFRLKEKPASATIHVTADSRYKLYVNGTFVGRGPARADQRWESYDSYDIASHLRAGENVIAVIVHQYGVTTHSYTLGRGGLLLQGEVGGQVLDTNSSWKVLPSPAWQRPTPRICPAIMWMEIYDARKEPTGWMAAGFDDSPWSPARERGRPPASPWKNLIPRDIPFLLEKEIFPTAILDQGTVEMIEDQDVVRRAAREPHHPGPTLGLKDAGKLLKSGDGPAVVCTDKSDVYATIDFGKEVSGYVRLRLNGVAGGIVDLGYSEVLKDGRVDIGREGPWGFADRYIMRDGSQEWELFFWKGFRYLQLTFRNCPKPVEVESVSLLFTSYPVDYRGMFECSDAKLNRIWDVGRWTLQLCMHDGYEDTPWREQGQWVGDAQVEMMANYMTFGDIALASKCLRQVAEGQSPNGLLPAMYPAATMPSQGEIPTFMCQWVSSLLDHYRYTGERKLISRLYPNVKRLMGYFDRHLDDHGLLAGVPGFVFLDWTAAPPSQIGVELTGLNCHYYRALVDAVELASIEKDEARRTEWLGKAQRVKQSLNQRFWSDEKGVYLPGLSGDKPLPQFTVHDTVLAIWSGVAPADRIQRGLAALREADPQEFTLIGTPYFYWFYLGALRRAGEHRAAAEITRAAYGQMLEEGATTWWEHFSGMASHSHAWSCAPNFDLPAYVLGVQPTKPGFAEFRVEPHPSGLDWANGTVPTPSGDIKVQWKRDGQNIEVVVDVPAKTRAELVLPADRRSVTGPGTFRLTSAAAKDRPASLAKTLITRTSAVVFPGQGGGPPPSLPQTMQAEPAQMLETGLGPQFIVFRDKVQKDLEVSDDQKRKLQEHMESVLKEMTENFQSFGGLEPEERGKKMGSYRQKAEEDLAAFLQDTLTKEQLRRMRQLTLQREGLFTLGHSEMMSELKLTDQQKHQFMSLIQEMQEAIEPVIKAAQSRGRPEEIGPRLMKPRRKFEGKIETILSDAQKKQWKEMLGKPLDLGD